MKVILSFDYELFFGEKSGTVLKSIIEPTNKLLAVMEKNGFRGNFFVDYMMFRELEKQTDDHARTDLKMLKDQIHDMIRRGHRIELHIHPHWIDAKYNGDGTWDFEDFSHYSLSSLEEQTIIDMFVNGTSYLTDLARLVDPSYRIVAFRAGGWAIQPFNRIKQGFIEAGILVDSSASFGIYKYMEDSYYDFRSIPDKCFYRFEDDVCQEVSNGRFLEVPITSFHIPPALYLREMYIGKKTDYFKSYADGTHYRNDLAKYEVKKSVLRRIKARLDRRNRNLINFSFISLSPIRRFLKKCDKEILVCFIDHPKDVSPSTIDGILGIGDLCESVNYIDLI